MKKYMMLTDDQIDTLREEVLIAIYEHGWRCEDGTYLAFDEVKKWSDEMFVEAYDKIFGLD